MPDHPFERKLRIENATQPNSSFLVKQDCLPVPSPISALVFYFKIMVGQRTRRRLGLFALKAQKNIAGGKEERRRPRFNGRKTFGASTKVLEAPSFHAPQIQIYKKVKKALNLLGLEQNIFSLPTAF